MHVTRGGQLASELETDMSLRGNEDRYWCPKFVVSTETPGRRDYRGVCLINKNLHSEVCSEHALCSVRGQRGRGISSRASCLAGSEFISRSGDRLSCFRLFVAFSQSF